MYPWKLCNKNNNLDKVHLIYVLYFLISTIIEYYSIQRTNSSARHAIHDALSIVDICWTYKL